MFSLTIVFGPGPMVWTLMYKDGKIAKGAFSACQENCANGDGFYCRDDFGQEALISKGNIAQGVGLMLEDMEQSKLAHIERALHQTRVKVKADEMARVDPAIRAAMMQGGGSAILQPAMPANGGWRG